MKLLTSFVFLQQSEILGVFRTQTTMLVKGSDTVTLLIISVVLRYFQLNFLFPTFLADINQPMFCNTLYFKFFGGLVLFFLKF